MNRINEAKAMQFELMDQFPALIVDVLKNPLRLQLTKTLPVYDKDVKAKLETLESLKARYV